MVERSSTRQDEDERGQMDAMRPEFRNEERVRGGSLFPSGAKRS